MNMAGTDIRSACMSIPEDWQRLAFDALMLPVFDLKLTDRETGIYAAGAASAAQRITWTPYDAARKSFLEEARELLRIRPLSVPVMNQFRRNMYVRYMENRIRYYQNVERSENCSVPAVPVGEQDFLNTEMASVFAHLPDQPDTCRWLKELDISWTYDRLHMVTWFACQLSLGSGKYSRSRPNHSAKTTYGRLLNPFSLLWIAAALGEDRALVEKVRRETDEYVSWRAKCGVVRRAIPWSRIYELALPLVKKERSQKHVAAG